MQQYTAEAPSDQTLVDINPSELIAHMLNSAADRGDRLEVNRLMRLALQMPEVQVGRPNDHSLMRAEARA